MGKEVRKIIHFRRRSFFAFLGDNDFGHSSLVSMKKNIIRSLFALIILAIISGAGFYFMKPAAPAVQTGPFEYKNTDFGFSIMLPEDWRGYTVTLDTWTGNAINDQLGEVAYTTGTVVSIHNPKWTAEKPYQDIPIMVFTPKQWSDLVSEKFHIGAAPIGPSVLGQNAKYVFALPARYNFAFPPGYEEVEQILEARSFKAF